MMKKVLLLLHPGVEEIEAVTAIDLLRRAGIEVLTVSVTSDLEVIGGRGIALKADALLSADPKQTFEAFDMLVIPGGPGVDELRKHPGVLELVRRFHREDRLIAAICAAPLVLLDAGITPGHTLTSFPSAEEELRPKVKAYVSNRVVRDGKLITSRGAGTAEEFSLALIEILAGPEAAEQTRKRIVAR
jgi:4-methyl-5(b-hydroxyethyl)-thiazole monophosphate biosynthesis